MKTTKSDEKRDNGELGVKGRKCVHTKIKKKIDKKMEEKRVVFSTLCGNSDIR